MPQNQNPGLHPPTPAALQTFAQTIADVSCAAAAGAADPQQQLRAAAEHLVLFLTRSSVGARILLVESSGLGARLERVRRGVLDSHAHFFEKLLARLTPPLQMSNATLVARCCLGSV